MTRRARRSTAEDLLDLVSRLPWWACAVLGIISYLLLSWYTSLPSPAADVASTADIASAIFPTYLRGIATAALYVLPALFGVAAVVSLVRNSRRPMTSREGRGLGAGIDKGVESGDVAPASTSPSCPQCNGPMMQRRAKRGTNAGNSFWGCVSYPSCRGTRPLD